MKYSMTQSMIKRRTFLGGCIASAGASLLPLNAQASAKNNNEIWLSAQGRDAEHFALSWVQNDQQQSASVKSGFRGHGAAQHPLIKTQAVMFSRSPGTEGIVVDLSRGEIVQRFYSATNHHMHGHGCFSADGSILFTTESDYQTGAGKIVMRETRHYQTIGAWSSYGIGPHDIQLMPDQKTLVVANGGLRTRPESGAQVLNLDSMESSLTYIDSISGELLGQYRLTEAKASIRHLDVAADGTVALATQVQRQGMSDEHTVTLAAVHHPGSAELIMLEAPQTLTERFNDYMGSVAINEKERLAGFSSPRGDLVGFWHIDSGQLAGYHAFHDVCGLSVSQDQQYFILSNSAGEIRRISALSLQENRQLRQQFDGMHWDNHLFSVALS